MAVTREDVLHVASLVRLGISDERAEQFTSQLNTILGHMDVLAKVDVKKLEPVEGVGAESAPLRDDSGPSIKMETKLADFAPAVRDGFLLVPRLSTHETAAES